jgi:hypothetical protein
MPEKFELSSGASPDRDAQERRRRDEAVMKLLDSVSECITGMRNSIAGRILTYRKGRPRLDEPQRALLDEINRLAWEFHGVFRAQIRAASGLGDGEFEDLEERLALEWLSRPEPDRE